jgi:hypothetical protein
LPCFYSQIICIFIFGSPPAKRVLRPGFSLRSAWASLPDQPGAHTQEGEPNHLGAEYTWWKKILILIYVSYLMFFQPATHGARQKHLLGFGLGCRQAGKAKRISALPACL